MLNDQLRTTAVRHVALPWGIAGEITRRAVAETGHVIAFAERPLRSRLVRAGDDRYGLMRLNGKFLTCLPGRGASLVFHDSTMIGAPRISETDVMTVPRGLSPAIAGLEACATAGDEASSNEFPWDVQVAIVRA